MPMIKSKVYNLDTFLLNPQLDAADIYKVDTILKTTRVLDRLYGRQVATRFFTKHIEFDSIKITVK